MVESEAMQYRSLGRSGLKVSALSYGNMNTGFLEGNTEEWSFDHLKKCIDLGVNFIDTAEVYGYGKAETVLGNDLKRGGWDRDDLIISDKLNPRVGIQGLSRKRVRSGLSIGLKRLQLDNVDLLFLHRFDSEVPLLETIRAVNDAIDNDLAYYWGTSAFSAQQLIDCHRLCEKHGLIAPIVEQCEYNLVTRKTFEVDYVPLFDQYGMGTTIWSPLAGGLLSGRFNNGGIPEDSRINHYGAVSPMMVQMNSMRMAGCSVEGLQALGALAVELGCTQSQLALAWTLKNKDVSTAVFGASKISQIEDNVGALAVLPKLTAEVLARIEDFMKTKPEAPFDWRTMSPSTPRR
jgi:voltage-dependent potassium channel beta subunit